MFLCYPSHIEGPGSHINASYPCLFQLHLILWLRGFTASFKEHQQPGTVCPLICHLSCSQFALAFADVWIQGSNRLAVANITVSTFVLLIHSSVHGFLGLWSTLILLILARIGLSLYTTSNYVETAKPGTDINSNNCSLKEKDTQKCTQRKTLISILCPSLGGCSSIKHGLLARHQGW